MRALKETREGGDTRERRGMNSAREDACGIRHAREKTSEAGKFTFLCVPVQLSPCLYCGDCSQMRLYHCANLSVVFYFTIQLAAVKTIPKAAPRGEKVSAVLLSCC